MTLTIKTETPELDKMLEVKDDSQKIGNFLDWLYSKGYTIQEFVEKKLVCDLKTCDDVNCDFFTRVEELFGKEKCPNHHHDAGCYTTLYDNGEWQIIKKGIEQLLAEYFSIDLNKAEKERTMVLEDLRKKNGKGG